MKAVLCKQHGLPDTLVLEDVPSPEPGPKQVVITVKACGVNFPDTLIIQNKYQFKPDLPFSPGGEIAGVVPCKQRGLRAPLGREQALGAPAGLAFLLERCGVPAR